MGTGGDEHVGKMCMRGEWACIQSKTVLLDEQMVQGGLTQLDRMGGLTGQGGLAQLFRIC